MRYKPTRPEGSEQSQYFDKRKVDSRDCSVDECGHYNEKIELRPGVSQVGIGVPSKPEGHRLGGRLDCKNNSEYRVNIVPNLHKNLLARIGLVYVRIEG